MLLKTKKILVNIIIPILIALFNLLIIFYPKEIIAGSKDGLLLWFNNVLPALLPFIIGINLLTGLGITHFIGTILEPIMYPLFGISGIGGFPLISGMTSGYPMGAKITADLRTSGQISKQEAQKLISFTNNSGPLFIIGSVGLGMFNNPRLGYFILLCHYAGALIIGLLLKTINTTSKPTITNRQSLISRGMQNMKNARYKDNRRLPTIFADSIKNSMESIIVIGGYIILFSVVAKILDIINLTKYIDIFFIKFTNLSINENFLKGITSGIIEMTNGIKMLSGQGIKSSTVIGTIFLVSFGGFSIHLQSINFISKTDINMFLYMLSKGVHGIISAIIGFFLFPLFDFNESVSVFSNYNKSFFSRLSFSSWSFVLVVIFIILLMIISNILVFSRKKNNLPRKY